MTRPELRDTIMTTDRAIQSLGPHSSARWRTSTSTSRRRRRRYTWTASSSLSLKIRFACSPHGRVPPVSLGALANAHDMPPRSPFNGDAVMSLCHDMGGRAGGRAQGLEDGLRRQPLVLHERSADHPGASPVSPVSPLSRLALSPPSSLARGRARSRSHSIESDQTRPTDEPPDGTPSARGMMVARLT